MPTSLELFADQMWAPALFFFCGGALVLTLSLATGVTLDMLRQRYDSDPITVERRSNPNRYWGSIAGIAFLTTVAGVATVWLLFTRG